MIRPGDRIRAAFEQHRSEPHISLDQHVRRRRIALGESLVGKLPLYLDTKYWIVTRDVLLGRRTASAEIELVEHLLRLARSRRVYCPISETVFLEIMKQEDSATRTRVVELVDELSLGVTLCPSEERVQTELAHTFYGFQKGLEILPLALLVWSRLSYVLGTMHPVQPEFDDQTQLVMQKAFFDHLWDVSLSQMIQTLGEDPFPDDPSEATAQKLNEGSQAHAHEIRSYKQAYAAEAAGGVSLLVDTAMQILEEIEERVTGSRAPQLESQAAEYRRAIQGLLTGGLCNGKLALALPTLHVHTCCHAAARWDKKRKLVGNDLHDFNHAAAAVAYCRGFFTERPLKAMLTQRHVGLDKLFDCAN